MRLKQVEINGFKSFPDKVEINFDEGIIAIVGPNGSGKSNVVDAVRWVLGEQSSKTLRGGKMEDVIFTGTQHRKAVGMAEVSLVIDNADGALPTPLAEVKVTRRLYRSGESEYLLAGRPVRLRDIHELFMNTGIGRDGYSLIGQGKIAEVLSSRSEDRRAIFEEAAGISKYRYRRAESARRLEATESNLVRLRDILGGYAARVEPLRLQSEKARKYLDYRNERKGLEINVWLERLEQTKDLISKSEDDYQIVTDQLEQMSNCQRGIERQLAALDQQTQSVNVEMDEALRSQRTLEQQAAQSRSDAAVMENEIKHNRERRAALVKSMELSQERQEALLEKDVQAVAKEEQLQAQHRALEQQLAALTQKMTGDALADMQQRIAQQRIAQLELGDALGRCRVEMANAQTAQQAQGDNEAQAKAELAALDEAAQAARLRLHEAQQRLAQQQATLLRGKNAIGGYEKKLEVRREKTQQAQDAEREAQNMRSQAEQRLRVLEDLEKNKEGFSGAVKLVLQEAEHGRLPGVHGALSSLIGTQQETTLAIETALGPAMQHIVVDTEQQAKSAILLLKSKNAGRATFLPLSAVQKWGADKLPREGEGVVGVAAELVFCDEQYRALIASLLGRTLVARDIDAAIAIAKRHGYRFRIVTLDGQLVNAGGSLTGGSQARGTGVLSRRKEIETLAARLADLREKELQAHERLLACQEEQRLVGAEMQGALSELQTAKEEHIKNIGEIESAQGALQLLLQNEAALRSRCEQAQQAQTAASAALELAQQRERELLLRQSEIEQTLAALERDHGEQAKRVEREMQEIGECRLALTALERDRQALADSRRETKELLSLQGADREELEKELAKLTAQEGDLVAEMQRSKEGEAGYQQRTAQLVQQVKELTKKREDIEGDKTALRTTGKRACSAAGKPGQRTGALRGAARAGGGRARRHCGLALGRI